VSFALLVYVSAWLKCYYPDVFACALLNSLPMGFYQPAQIIIDARQHGVEVRPVDVNHSQWDHSLEEQAGNYKALRLGLRLVKGLSEQDAHVLLSQRPANGFSHPEQLRTLGLDPSVLEKLADADAFQSLQHDRRQALWKVANQEPVSALYRPLSEEIPHELPGMSLSEHVVQDYAATSLSLKAHPVHFVRETLTRMKVVAARQLPELAPGSTVKVAGLVLVRQRPGTAKGVCFITLEDETGVINLVVFAKQFDKYRKEIICSRLLMVSGKVQREGLVIHVVVQACFDATQLLHTLAPHSMAEMPSVTLPTDETTSPPPDPRNGKRLHSGQASIWDEGRNFR
jgi:error-prone DNA polymerase